MPVRNCAARKQLIENFIAGINDVDDVMNEWHDYVAVQREYDLRYGYRGGTTEAEEDTRIDLWRMLFGMERSEQRERI